MSFLRNFMVWNEGTEVPEQYYFWGGISALAAMVNGQVWIHMGRYQIFPNMYIALLGPPANGKTSAIRRAEKVIRSFDDIPISAQSETAEGLVKFLMEHCQRTIDLDPAQPPTVVTPVTCVLSELSNFFGRDPGGMIDLLTGIWDCGGDEYHRRTKNSGEFKIPRPNVNLIAGTTQDWITTYLKTDIIGGGFTRRVVFVNENMTDDTIRVAWPEDTPERLVAFQNVLAYAAELRKVKGEMQYDTGAKSFFIKWYDTRPIPRDFDVRGYHKSKPGLLLKVATLIALSKQPEKVVRVEDLEVALALLDRTEPNLSRVFQGIGRNELNSIAHMALEMLHSAPEVELTFTKLSGEKEVRRIRAMDEKRFTASLFRHAPGREVQDILHHLFNAEKIIRYPAVVNNVARTFIAIRGSE